MSNNALAQYIRKEEAVGYLKQQLSSNAHVAEKALLVIANGSVDFSAIDPRTIIKAVVNSTLTGLDPNPIKGECYFIPYGDKIQFQVGWKGLMRLAIASGEIMRVGVKEVIDGEFKGYDDFGEPKVEFNDYNPHEAPIIGYYASFQTRNGFVKKYYMTMKQLEQHALTYSQTYKKNKGVWKTNFDAMAKKTVLKLMLDKFAPKSDRLSEAIKADQSEVEKGGYLDNDPHSFPVVEEGEIVKVMGEEENPYKEGNQSLTPEEIEEGRADRKELKGMYEQN